MRRLMIALMICVVAACGSVKKMRTMENDIFDKQGHRGCRGLMPENTIPAMLKAIDLGVTTLETDVVFTKDNKAILSHEPFFNHEISTKPDGSAVTEAEEHDLNIYRMDYAEVRRFDVGMRPHPRFPLQKKMPVYKPLLAEMIYWVELYCARNEKPLPYYNIETKTQPATDNIYHPPPDVFVEQMMAVIKEQRITARAIIQSFDPRTLQYLHQHYPEMKTALLIEDTDKAALAIQLKNLGFIPTIYSPHFSLVTPLLVKQCRDLGVKLIPWTVNDRGQIEALRKMGVNGVISDFPDLFNKEEQKKNRLNK